MATLKVRDENNNFVDIPFVSGPAGKSAYEVWLENGNTGGEVTFLTSLKAQVPTYDVRNNAILYINSTPLAYINFTIAGIAYTAIEGMTWNEFISSEYNVNNYVSLSSDCVHYGGPSDNGWLVTNEDWYGYSSGTDVIINGTNYICNNEPI